MDNGIIRIKMVGEGRSMLMGRYIRVIGKIIYLMGMEERYLLMDKYMKDNGIKVNVKEKEFSLERMELHIQDNGWIICRMVMVIKNGQMVYNIKVIL